jgi:hypothetical protein
MTLEIPIPAVALRHPETATLTAVLDDDGVSGNQGWWVVFDEHKNEILRFPTMLAPVKWKKQTGSRPTSPEVDVKLLHRLVQFACDQRNTAYLDGVFAGRRQKAEALRRVLEED